MQFNFVISTNQDAIRLWTKLGFDTVGHLPKAFNHPEKGYVDASAVDTIEVTSSPEDERKLLVGVAIDE